MAKEVIDMYDEFSDAKTLYNYMSVWVEPGDYRKIVALYKSTDESNYILRTITLSKVDSYLCSDGIRGIGYSEVNWEEELSLDVFVRSQ